MAYLHGHGIDVDQCPVDPEQITAVSASSPECQRGCNEPECSPVHPDKTPKNDELSLSEVAYVDSQESNPATAQILGVAILEFGILFHSVRIVSSKGMCMSLF